MITIQGQSHGRFCDGVSRRDALRLGGLALGGLSLPGLLQAEAQAGIGHSHKSVIMVFLPGGPPHTDMVDMKPDAPAEIRGEFRPIKTNVPGIEISELMPRLARIMDKVAIVRSIADCVNEHTSWHCLSGYPQSVSRMQGVRPSIGPVISKLQGPADRAVPAAVNLFLKMKIADWQDPGPGYFGSQHAAYQPIKLPRWRRRFSGPWLPGPENTADMILNFKRDRLKNRKTLLQSFDRLRRDLDTTGAVEGADAFQSRALDFLTSSKVADALDVTREDPRVRARYGLGSPQRMGSTSDENPHAGPLWNDQFLMARRLVEAGVRCVTLTFAAWDFHSHNFVGCRRYVPPLDHALSALIEDLHGRGLDQDVTVIVWGEFGRAPRIDRGSYGGGRNHWPQASCALLAGGGMRTGQVIGSTDSHGSFPKDRPVKMQNVFATLYHNIGIDPSTRLPNHLGLPTPLLDDCEPIHELI